MAAFSIVGTAPVTLVANAVATLVANTTATIAITLYAAIGGDVSTQITPTATMGYTPASAAIVGAANATFTSNATLLYTANQAIVIVGAADATFTSNATLSYTPDAAAIVGAADATFTSNATLLYTPAVKSIVGTTTVDFTANATFLYAVSRAIIGTTTIDVTSSSVMDKTSNNSISGATGISVTANAVMVQASNYALVGATTASVAVDSTTYYNDSFRNFVGDVTVSTQVNTVLGVRRSNVVNAGSSLAIAYDDLTVDASTTITGLGWDNLAPASNVGTIRLASSAVATQNNCSINMDLGSAKAVEVLSLPRHTINEGGTWRVRLSNNSLLLTDPTSVPEVEILIDSGVRDVWPDISSITDQPFSTYSNWEDTLENLHNPPALMFLTTGTTSRYVRLDIWGDSTDYTVSKVLIAPLWRPSYGLSPNWSTKYISQSKPVRIPGGPVYIESGARYRQVAFKCANITSDEALEHLPIIDRAFSTSRPYLAILDPSDAANLHRMYIYGTNSKLTPMVDVVEGFYTKNFLIDEWL